MIEHWKNSYPLRKVQSETTIEQQFEKWPILKTEIAPALVSVITLFRSLIKYVKQIQYSPLYYIILFVNKNEWQ